jgi:inosose dehydratase
VIVVANAPVSYGAFEMTVGIDPNVPDGMSVLDEVTSSGYAGIDLGPVGYLGRGAELGERLRDRGLGLAGAYLELPFWDPDALDRSWTALEEVLDTFDALGAIDGKPPPRPTLAAAGTEVRHANPGRAVRDRSLGLDDAGWTRFGEGLGRVVARSRDRGYEPTFHPETGTYVEAPWEIERVLAVGDVGLCLETGHLIVGGGDPVRAVADWGSRINHVHLKDARRSIVEGIVRDGAPSSAIWSREAFVPLGNGDLDVDGVLDALHGLRYEGWLVVEQDSFPKTAERFAQAAADQRANRAFLAARGL